MSDVGSVKYRVELDNSHLDQDVSKTESSIASKLDAISGKLSQSFGYQVLKDIGGAFIDMGKQAVGALTSITQAALDSTASMEQNIGGVETLFKDSADTVIANAKRAYETAGMSANTYMETVTSFSASLLQSLGGDTEQAAKVADMAIIDMSDNANKMGTDIASVQAAYQGFAKQQYQLLDNLKLGYGGTKTEMERLLKDAQKITGIKYDISNLNDVYSAIHVIQEELDITGTTAAEASTTIEGSMNSAKAAWDNFLNGSISGDELASTMLTAATNIGENIVNIFSGFSDQIPELITGLVDGFVPLLEELLPPIIEGVGTLITAIGDALLEHLPDILFFAGDMMEAFFNGMLEATSGEGGGYITEIITWILGIFHENYSQLFDVGLQIITNIINGMAQNIPLIAQDAVIIIEQLAESIVNNLPMLLDAAVNIMETLADTLIDNLPMVLDAAVSIVTSLANGIGQRLPDLIPKATQAVLTIVQELTSPERINQLIESGIALLTGLVEGLVEALPILIEMLPDIIITIVTTLIDNLPKIIDCGMDILEALIKGIVDTIPKLIEAIPKIISAIWDTILETDWLELGSKILTGFIDGIESMFGALGDVLGDLVDMIADAIGGPVGDAIKWGKDLVCGFIDGVKSVGGALKDGLCWVGEQVSSVMHFSVPDEGPMADADTWGPDFMELLATGIKDNAYKVTDAVKGVAGDIAVDFEAGVEYDVPDIAGYARDLSASITGTGQTQIEVPVILDGREIARASAWYMGEQLAWEAR